jgi:hypothetical protein
MTLLPFTRLNATFLGQIPPTDDLEEEGRLLPFVRAA